MTGRKIKIEDRWKRRTPPKHSVVLAPPMAPKAADAAPAIAFAPIAKALPNDETLTSTDQVRIDYGLAYRARIKALGDDALKEEYRLRAFDAMVYLFRADNPGVDIDTANAAMRAIIARTGEAGHG